VGIEFQHASRGGDRLFEVGLTDLDRYLPSLVHLPLVIGRQAHGHARQLEPP
jgi:hypothetical protein